MNTSEVLNRAADLIEARGWTWGDGWDAPEGEPLCAEGAIQAAMGIDERRIGLRGCPAYKAVQKYIETDRGIWIWNDSLVYEPDGRGGLRLAGGTATYQAAERHAAEQVIATLRAAAVIEAAKETAAEPVTQPESVSV